MLTEQKISSPKMISYIAWTLIIILAFSFLAAMTNLATVGMIILVALFYYINQPSNIYMVDFACYKPDSSLMVTREQFIRRFRHFLGDDAGDFLQKVLHRSGLGDKTYLPTSLQQIPPKSRFGESREELEMVMFGVIDALLEKNHVQAKDIGIVIVNSSTFSPTPSLSDTIVNHYKFCEDVVNYDLGGMGCSAGLISIQLAKQILQIRPMTYALVVSVESITHNCYAGSTNKSMLVSNCLFRIGGAAILLSNFPSDRSRSKYQLVHVVRTHRGPEDRSYNCVFEENDEKGIIGISLSKDLMAMAAQALKANIMTMGPLVLPISEQFNYVVNLLQRKVVKGKMKSYVPDFKKAFDHFCVHAGGRGVLDEMEVQLGLSKWDIEPSKMSLFRFGNTSSSSVWYELAYCEAKGRIKKNDRIWQIAFGSGFKCNSVVWKGLRGCEPTIARNPWMGEIDDFPIQVAT
ncbi:hypothetical protein Leryth_026078 [Lithospermum erythrorhizon]|uniref:3-ketoacyl-CoA synthase n=1 Tax=Lithospermum erythrorhizon TaxID=34254 RepID=A0AAV3RYE5_LITER|nr:hypothetical protein Leryth_026078 [Lithospermum erythrorhizon]